MLAAGDNFVVSPTAIDRIQFTPPFINSNKNPSATSWPNIHRPGYRIIALACAGTFTASLWSSAAARGGGGILQTLIITEVDIARAFLHEIWSAPLPQQLYIPDSAFLQAAARRPDDDDNDDREESSQHPQPFIQQYHQQSSPDVGVVMSIERGNNGAVAIAWASTDVVAIVEPPRSNEPGGTIVICKKRVEHPALCLALSSDFVFTVSGPSGRLQSWHRKSGEISRDGGILSSLMRVSCMVYEPSEAVLLVGFESGLVRLVSVERNAALVTLSTIDVAGKMFPRSASALPASSAVLCISCAQRATGDAVVTTAAGFALLNLRTQQLAKVRFCFAENGVEAGTPFASFAVASTQQSKFIVICGGSDHQQPLVQIIPCGILLERFFAAIAKPSAVGGVSASTWSQQRQQRQPEIALHDDISDISSLCCGDGDDDLSSITTNDAIRPFSAAGGSSGWLAIANSNGTTSPSSFSIAQHSNISYNANAKHDEQDPIDDRQNEEQQEEEDQYSGDDDDENCILEESGEEDEEEGLQGEHDDSKAENDAVSPPASTPQLVTKNSFKPASSAPWKHPQKIPVAAAANGKRVPPAASSSAVGSGKNVSGKVAPSAPRVTAGSKSSSAAPAATRSKAATVAATVPPPAVEIVLLPGNPLCLLPSLQARAEQLPAPLSQPFLLAQAQDAKKDPAAKPVTFNRGGPIKSSGYSSSTPWSVQQAEKTKRKKAQQVAAKKAALPPQPVATMNYNTACGATVLEYEAATKIFDKAPLHGAAVTASAFDVTGSVFFTTSNDGTVHALKWPVVKHDGHGFALNASLATGAVVTPSASPSSLAVVSSPGGGAASSSSTTAATPTFFSPVLSIDVGVSRPSSCSSSASWNCFVTSSVGGGVTIWAPSPQSGAAPRIRHNFSRDVRSVRLCLRDNLLLAASGSTISLCRFALDSGLANVDELHRSRNLSRFSVVQECTPSSNGAQAVLCMDTFNSFDSAGVVFGTSSKQVGMVDLRRADAGAAWAVDDAHQRPVHAVALQRCSAFAFDPLSPTMNATDSDSQQALCIFATAAVDNSVRLWDLRMKSVARVLNKHVNTGMQLGLTMSPCSRFVACGSEDRSVVLYDIGQGSIVSKMKTPDNATTLRYHPLRPQLIAGLANGKGRMWIEPQQQQQQQE